MLKPTKTPPEPDKQIEQKSIWKAPQVAGKLATAKTALSDLEKRYRALAADAVLSESTDDSALTSIEKEITQAKALVQRLTVAHSSAIEADTLLRERHLEEGRKSQVRVVAAQLRIADKAVEAFSSALAEAIKAYAAIVEHRVKAGEAASSPIFGNIDAMRLIQDAACYEKAIFRFAEKEIARSAGQILGVVGIGGEARFPGANPWDGNYRLQPENLPPIADELHMASDQLLTKLKDKITAPGSGLEESEASEQQST